MLPRRIRPEIQVAAGLSPTWRAAPVLLAMLAVAIPAWAQPTLVQPATERLSVGATLLQANRASELTAHNGAVSADGHTVVFVSAASNLVPDDTDYQQDVFVRDLRAAASSITRVSVPVGGGATNGASSDAVISANGRFVAFTSLASNLVAGDTNDYCDVNGDDVFGENCSDVFVRDLDRGVTTRISLATGGVQANGPSYLGMISSSGRYVVFFSYASNLGSTADHANVFLHDRTTGTTVLVSRTAQDDPGDNTSWLPTISGDERFVVFASAATNLAAGGTNGREHVFVFNLRTAQMELVSVAADGAQGDGTSTQPAISWDGRYVAFESAATNLVAGDSNGRIDVFLRDRRTGVTSRVSVGNLGEQGDRDSTSASISGDARWVAFQSGSTTFAAGSNGVTQVWVRDALAGRTHRISVSSGGVQGNQASSGPAISGSGRYLAFTSLASTLVAGDTNGVSDVFLVDARPWVNHDLVQLEPNPRGGLAFFNTEHGGRAYTGSMPDPPYSFSPAATPWSPGWTIWKQDVNEDGLADFFLYNKTTGLWYDVVNGAGFYGPSNDFMYYGGLWSPGWDVTILDLNGDGRSDVFVYNPDTGAWYKCIRQRPGEFTYYGGTWSRQWQVYPASLNGDTLMDMFLYRPSTGDWYWVLSGAEGTFTSAGGRWDSDWHVTVGAFNDDALDDVFVYNRENGQWLLCLNNGNTITPFTVRPGQWSPGWDVYTTYLDPDNLTDLFVYDRSTGSFYECVRNPVPTPDTEFSYFPGGWSPGWQLYISDFNGDGAGDILTYNPVSGLWYRCIAIGVGSFSWDGGVWGAGWTILTKNDR